MEKIKPGLDQFKALCATVGKITYEMFLATKDDLYDETTDKSRFALSEEKGYESYENYQSDKPFKRARPLTIMGGAKTILAAHLAALVNTVNEAGKVQAGKVQSSLVNSKKSEDMPVKFMILLAEGMNHRLIQGRLDRDGRSVEYVKEKLMCYVKDKNAVSPIADELSRIFVRFLKCVACGTCNFACETKVTLNKKFLRGLLRNFKEGKEFGKEFGEEYMDWLDTQCRWVDEHYASKKKPSKRSPKKSASAPAPKKGAAPKKSAPVPAPKKGAAPKKSAPVPAPKKGAAPAPKKGAAPAPKKGAAPAPKKGAAPKKSAPAPASEKDALDYDDMDTIMDELNA
jgi:ferredoxin